MSGHTIEGNYYDKYGTSNRLFRRIVKGYSICLTSYLMKIHPERVLEIGCGEGSLLEKIQDTYSHLPFLAGLDFGASVLNNARKRGLKIPLIRASATTLPIRDDAFDLVLAPEVLEHLENPDLALAELVRCGSHYFILSVPQEPVWRMGNMICGRYIGQFGNTPGHIQHWSRRGFIEFIGDKLKIIDVASPFPWTMVFAERYPKNEYNLQ